MRKSIITIFSFWIFSCVFVFGENEHDRLNRSLDEIRKRGVENVLARPITYYDPENKPQTVPISEFLKIANGTLEEFIHEDRGMTVDEYLRERRLFPPVIGEFSIPDTNGVHVGKTITAIATVRNLLPLELTNAKFVFIGNGVFKEDGEWVEHTHDLPTVASNSFIQASHQFNIFHEGKQTIRVIFYAEPPGYLELDMVVIGGNTTPNITGQTNATSAVTEKEVRIQSGAEKKPEL